MTSRFPRLLSLAAPALAAAVLAGCAMAGARHDHSHDAAHASMDMQSMCEMHKKHMSGKSPAERQAMMDEHMKSMAPDMRRKMEAMHAQCQ
jgi:hypothetical protein